MARDNVRGFTKPADQQRLEQERALRNQIAQGMAAGSLGVVDRFGNKVEVGQFVLFHTPLDQIWQVMEVAPVMDIRQQAGLARITLSATVPFTTALSQRTMNLAVIGRLIADGEPAVITGPIVPGEAAGDTNGDEQGTREGEGEGDSAAATAPADGEGQVGSAASSAAPDHLGDKTGA